MILMKDLVNIIFILPTLIFCSCSTTKLSNSNFFANNGYVAIPLKKNAVGHFEVTAKINHVVGRFTLDTGASSSAIDKSHLKKFRIKENEIGQSVVAGGLGTTNNKATIIRLNRLELGAFRIRRLSIIATDLSQVNKALASSGVEQQDGVIGADVLSQGKAIIDYESKKLFLQPLKN